MLREKLQPVRDISKRGFNNRMLENIKRANAARDRLGIEPEKPKMGKHARDALHADGHRARIRGRYIDGLVLARTGTPLPEERPYEDD